MGRRRADSPDEYDVTTPWRRLLHWRRGEASRIKRRMRRRERREARQQLRQEEG